GADWRATAPSAEALAWAAATLAGAGAGCLAALVAIPRVARAWRVLPRRSLAGGMLVLLAAVVALLNGGVGLAVLAVAACAGHLATAFGVSRVHGMGVVLVPVAWRLLL
ncbi:MAG TPA: hypothetical protein VI997_00200, partial [Candidatus Thermoplasmatota archaeon]|nr:hypothetical protein [Candidatus Thermoplasmatota archaeon]